MTEMNGPDAPPPSSPATSRPSFVNLNGDTAAVSPGGHPALLDVNSDATISGTGPWDSLQVTLSVFDAFDVLGIRQTPGVVRLAGGAVFINEIEIADLDDSEAGILYFTFNGNASTGAVETLIHALTYQNTSPQADLVVERSIGLGLADLGGSRMTAAFLKAAVAPQAAAPFVLTASDDVLIGDNADDLFQTIQGNLNPGDQLDGAGGNNTLELNGGGVFEISALAGFQNIQTIRGSALADSIVIHQSQLNGVTLIEDGGGTTDTLSIIGSDIDLTGLTITGFQSIDLRTNGAKITVKDAATALRVTGFGQAGANELILSQGTLTPEQKGTIFLNGIETITVGGVSETYRHPIIGNLNADRVTAVAGSPVFVDAFRDATLIASAPLAFLNVTMGVGAHDPSDMLGIDISGSVALSAGFTAGSRISVTIGQGTTEIGVLAAVANDAFQVVFNAAATPQCVEFVIQSITYARGAASTSGATSIEIRIGDALGSEHGVEVAVDAPATTQGPFVLTPGADDFTGNAADDTFEATVATLNAADRIDGADGNDTLKLNGGGISDIARLARFNSIETIVGSAGDDVIRIGQNQVSTVKLIDSGGVMNGDSLILVGNAIDLTGTTVNGFHHIDLETDGAKITVKDSATAKLVMGYQAGENELVLAQGTLTEAEKAAIFRNGIETITIGAVSETHHAPVITALDGDRVTAVKNAPVFIDANRDTTLAFDGELRFADFTLSGAAHAGDVLGINVNPTAGMSLKQGFLEGTEVMVTVNGVTTEIGVLGILRNNFLFFALNASATPELVSVLYRNITYTRSDASTSGVIEIDTYLHDTMDLETMARITIDPPGALPANAAPTDITLSARNATELAADGTVVGSLATIDPDANETFFYSLLDDAGGRFAISNGQIVVRHGSRLDFEQAASHQVSVRVTDKAGHALDRTFTISVDDILHEFSAGTPDNDRLVGGAGNDTFSGSAGDDVLIGGLGRDKLSGGLGRDILTGDGGKDIFLFDSAIAKKRNSNIDKITDFVVRDDSIYLENAIFKGLGKKGSATKPAKLSKDAFWKGAKAHDASDRIIYNEKTGALYYDQDGNGGKAAIKIATLPKKLKTISAGDFFIV